MRENEREWRRAKDRNLRWLDSLWEGTSTATIEEERKEEVLAVFRNLVIDSRS